MHSDSHVFNSLGKIDPAIRAFCLEPLYLRSLTQKFSEEPLESVSQSIAQQFRIDILTCEFRYDQVHTNDQISPRANALPRPECIKPGLPHFSARPMVEPVVA